MPDSDYYSCGVQNITLLLLSLHPFLHKVSSILPSEIIPVSSWSFLELTVKCCGAFKYSVK